MNNKQMVGCCPKCGCDEVCQYELIKRLQLVLVWEGGTPTRTEKCEEEHYDYCNPQYICTACGNTFNTPAFMEERNYMDKFTSDESEE